MNTSVKLNELIVNKSHDASLVIVNLPAPPRTEGGEENCILFIIEVCGGGGGGGGGDCLKFDCLLFIAVLVSKQGY